MTLQQTLAVPEEQPDPNAEADYIIQALQDAIHSGNLEAAGRVLGDLQNQNERDTRYPQGSPFLARASKVLLQHQIHRAGRAIAYGENPEIATGEILMLHENARRFMDNALSFHKASEHIYTAVSMNDRNMLPMTQEQAEAMFREAAGEAPEETGEPPLDSEDAAWIVHRHARETFMKIGFEFPDEDARDLSRFANMNLAMAAAAACAAGILNPNGSQSKQDRFPDVSP